MTRWIEVECEICTFPLGKLDLDTATLPLKAGMFKPLGEGYRAPFPDWRVLGLQKDLELGDDKDWYFKCPQCRKVPFIQFDRVPDTQKRYHMIESVPVAVSSVMVGDEPAVEVGSVGEGDGVIQKDAGDVLYIWEAELRSSRAKKLVKSVREGGMVLRKNKREIIEQHIKMAGSRCRYIEALKELGILHVVLKEDDLAVCAFHYDKRKTGWKKQQQV